MNPSIKTLKLTPDAHAAWKEFQRSIEDRLADGGEFEHMRDWAGKLSGAAARIAGLFHCYEYAGKQPHLYPVSVETMNRALSLSRKLSRHAVAVFDLMGADSDIEGARKVLQWLKKTGCVSFTGHECHSALKGTFTKRAELDVALQVLAERGYIRKADAKEARKPGRPLAGVYETHPSLRPGWGELCGLYGLYS